jgi:hypothetical protein
VGNVAAKIVEKIKTHILCCVTFSLENRSVCGIIWKNIVERGRPQMAAHTAIKIAVEHNLSFITPITGCRY